MPIIFIKLPLYSLLRYTIEAANNQQINYNVVMN